VGFCRYLSGNDLTGTIPTTVWLMTSMNILYASYHTPPCMSPERRWVLTWQVGFCRGLGDNDLTGTIPTTVGLMTSLEYLYASYHTPLHVALNDGGY
jgi:hypothetical protein